MTKAAAWSLGRAERAGTTAAGALRWAQGPALREWPQELAPPSNHTVGPQAASAWSVSLWEGPTGISRLLEGPAIPASRGLVPQAAAGCPHHPGPQQQIWRSDSPLEPRGHQPSGEARGPGGLMAARSLVRVTQGTRPASPLNHAALSADII